MKHSRKLLTMRLAPLPTSLAVVILIVAIFGFADASYLTIEHYQGAIPPCTTTGCESVLSSAYSVVYGIPVSLPGALYYLIVSVGLVAFLDSKNTNILKWTLSLTVLGLLASLWFIYLQAFVIDAWCQYCLGSAASSIALFILAGFVFWKYRASDATTDDLTTISSDDAEMIDR